MPSVDFGATVPVSWTSTSATTAVLNLTAPDGTKSTPAVTGGSGTAHASTFSASQAGRWFLGWVGADGEAYTDIVDAWPADPRFLISVADAQASLSQKTAMTAADIDDLRIYIAAATPVIEDITGPIILNTLTQDGDGSKSAIVLSTINVGVTSVTVDGTLIDPSQYRVSAGAGVVYAGGSSFGGTTVEVVYTVGGNNVIPPNVRLGTREEVRFLWQIGKQGGRPTPPQQSEAMTYTPSGFAVPKRVVQLLNANARTGGFA